MTRRKAVPIVKSPITWILVADGKQAHIYTRTIRDKKVPIGSGATHRHYDEAFAQELVQVPGMAWKAESPAIYETGRDRLGRVQESANSAHHRCEPRMDVHEEVKQHFMKALAEHLKEALAQKSFDKLVLVAPPRMLGELRDYVGKAVAKHIVAEMPKDLTHYEGDELLQHLKDSGLETA